MRGGGGRVDRKRKREREKERDENGGGVGESESYIVPLRLVCKQIPTLT